MEILHALCVIELVVELFAINDASCLQRHWAKYDSYDGMLWAQWIALPWYTNTSAVTMQSVSA